MITILAVPLPMEGPDRIAQRNAVGSWVRLAPQPEVILLGAEEGVAEYAKEVDVRHIPDVGVNDLGNLDISSVFEIGQQNATYDIVAFLDCDVILLGDFVDTVMDIAKRYKQFLLVGYRRDLTDVGELSFSPGWEHRVQEAFESRGRTFHKAGGSDYFIFRQGFFDDMPPFSIGAGHWDGWLMWYALEKRGVPLIDCTDAIYAIHQHHKHRGFRGRRGERENLALCDGNMCWLKDARSLDEAYYQS